MEIRHQYPEATSVSHIESIYLKYADNSQSSEIWSDVVASNSDVLMTLYRSSSTPPREPKGRLPRRLSLPAHWNNTPGPPPLLGYLFAPGPFAIFWRETSENKTSILNSVCKDCLANSLKGRSAVCMYNDSRIAISSLYFPARGSQT